MRLSIAAVLVLSTLASPASAGVRIVPIFDPAAYADRAAVGLLVPGAGPTVTHEGALAALVRGEVEHSLLDGVPDGEPLLELGAAGPPEILVSLPPPGRSENDRRYPIAVLGWRGVLTSDSTRIDGLVSITDIAHLRLRAEPSREPVQVLERLDDRIDRNDRLRLPLTFLVAFVVLALAVVRPPLALRALLVALAANLLLSPWLAAAAVVAALLLPLGAACAAVLVAYLAALGLDAETVALSPLGPSQSGRFYGINNLLETLLLVPALVGPALLGRLGLAVAAVALVTVGGNRFGADGGGLIVLLVGYTVLALLLTRRRLTLRLAAAGAAAVVLAALALVALDAATGGESHVTRAVGDGPGALAGDLGDRLELSARRATDSAGALAVVLGSLAVLAYVALRLPRSPLRDAFLAALLVSVLVNDTPTDVLGVGAAAAVALARARPLDSPPMRRPAVIALLALLVTTLALGVAACGGGEEVSPIAETVEGSLPAATTEEEGPASTLEGDPQAGDQIFTSSGCGACHVLEAAGSSGTVGPNLDESQPTLELAVDRVTNGSGAMPAFEGQLDEQQIADVAAFVVESTSG